MTLHLGGELSGARLSGWGALATPTGTKDRVASESVPATEKEQDPHPTQLMPRVRDNGCLRVENALAAVVRVIARIIRTLARRR